MKANLPGAEKLVISEFNSMIQADNILEAVYLAARSPNVIYLWSLYDSGYYVHPIQ